MLAAGGDHLLLVKENQPTLHADNALLFDPPTALGPSALVDRREAATHDRGHAASGMQVNRQTSLHAAGLLPTATLVRAAPAMP